MKQFEWSISKNAGDLDLQCHRALAISSPETLGKLISVSVSALHHGDNIILIKLVKIK